MYCNSSPLTFRNNERTALEFYKIPQPPTETAYKKTVGWAAVLFTRPKRKRTPNGGFETTDFKTAALSVTAPYPAPCGAAAPAVPAARCCKRSCGFARLLSLSQNGIPSAKAPTAESKTLLSEKNAGYTESQEKKRRVNELLTIRQNIDQVLHGVPRQQRDEHG